METTENQIDWYEQPKECVFDYKGNDCPAWALGQIRLPFALRTNLFILVGIFACELHWFSCDKVSFNPRIPWSDSHKKRAYSLLTTDKWKSLPIHF